MRQRAGTCSPRSCARPCGIMFQSRGTAAANLFVYKGTRGILTFSSSEMKPRSPIGWLLEGFNIDSGVTMTGGAALRLNT